MKKKIIRSGIILSFITLLGYIIIQTGWLKEVLEIAWVRRSINFFLLLYLLNFLAATGVLLLEGKSPSKTLSWLLVIVFLPVLGLMLYLFFGINYRKEKTFSKKETGDIAQIEQWKKEQLKSLQEKSDTLLSKFGRNDTVRHSIALLLNNSRAIYSEKNRVEIILGGIAKRDRLLRDLENARDHIHLEYYIIRDDGFGRAVKNVLIRKAREGVEVRVLYDDVGSWNLKPGFRESISQAGGHITAFRPVRFPIFTSQFNYRNHRKIVVVDGKIGYTGGMNINDAYINGYPQPWRDTQLRIEGEAVKMLQATFMLDWRFTTGEELEQQRYFPPVEVEEKALMQIVASGPDTEFPGIMHAYFNALCTARNYAYIATPYFVPNQSMLTAMQTAALSGVDVRLLIPKDCEIETINLTAHSYLESLMEAGVKVYFYQPGFIHAKILITDDVFASVGSANMDIRSFETNFEINAVLYDERVTHELKEQFLDDLKKARLLDLEEFRQRSVRRKLLEGVARLVAPML